MEKAPNVIINKNDFQFIKLDSNCFQLAFEITNTNIFIHKIVTFELINLIYKLNPGIFEIIRQEKLSETKINIHSLMKDLFSELGLPQYYSSLKIVKREIDNDNYIIFDCIANNTKLYDYPSDSEPIPLENVVVNFEIITDHTMLVTCDITLIEDHGLPPFSEKIIGNLIFKIFNKVKQFMENIIINA